MNMDEIFYQWRVFLNEDVFADLLNKFPQIKEKLTIAKERGVLPKYFSWLAKILINPNNHEPVEDIIPLLLSFEKNKDRLKAKFGGNVADINSYKSVGDLSGQLEKMSAQEKPSAGYEGVANADILYSDESWIVAMPHTTQASCELGKDTTWCTARTQSQNLFLSYVAREDNNIVLFYVINKKDDPRKNPNAKISVGFHDGKPVFDSKFGGITVNAANKGISLEEFSQIVGPENANKFLDLMKSKYAEIKGRHPAKKEFEDLVQNHELFIQKLKTFKNKEERDDFISLALQQKVISSKILENLATLLTGENRYFSDHENQMNLFKILERANLSLEIYRILINNANEDIRHYIARDKKTPPEILMELAQRKIQADQAEIAKNPNAPPQVLDYIIQTSFLIAGENTTNLLAAASNPNISLNSINFLLTTVSDYYTLMVLGTNRAMPASALSVLAKHKDPLVRDAVAENPNTSPETLTILSNDEDKSVRTYVAANQSTPPNVIMSLLSKYNNDVDIIKAIARNPKIPVEALMILANNKARYAKEEVAKNPHTPTEVLKFLATKEDQFEDIHELIATNPNVSTEILDTLSHYDNLEALVIVAKNKKTSPETLNFLSKHNEPSVRRSVAGNEKTPINILNVLSGDGIGYVANNAKNTLKKLQDNNLTENYSLRKLMKHLFV